MEYNKTIKPNNIKNTTYHNTLQHNTSQQKTNDSTTLNNTGQHRKINPAQPTKDNEIAQHCTERHRNIPKT